MKAEVCPLCGRTTIDRRARRKVVIDWETMNICVACDRMRPLSRARTMKGLKSWFEYVWGKHDVPTYITVVNPDGTMRWIHQNDVRLGGDYDGGVDFE